MSAKGSPSVSVRTNWSRICPIAAALPMNPEWMPTPNRTDAMVAAVAGSFLGLLIGGFLSEWHWKAIFWVGVPIGILGTVWGYKSLVELGERSRSKIDVPGNLTFGLGLTSIGMNPSVQPWGMTNRARIPSDWK